VRALDLKLWRDARRLAGPAVALSAILACGVSAQVALRGTARSLERSRDDFYARTRFADVAAEVVRAPLSVAAQAAALPGLTAVAPRITAWALVEVPGFADPVRLRAASLPEAGEAGLDAVVVREGTLPGRGEVLLGEASARRHRLSPGATVHAVLGGVRERLRVSGLGTAPDAVYVLAPALPFPDDARAGVMWLPRASLEGPLQLQGAFSELLVQVGPGERVQEVARRLEALLERHGGAGARARSEQPSHRFVDEELRQLAVQARFVPAVFLGVAAFLLRDVVARLLGTQRETVALLKALGFGRAVLVRHYLALAGLLLLPGAVAGAAAGAALVRALLGVYALYFRFDRLVPDVAAGDVGLSLAVAAGAGLLGAWASVRQATAIPPAGAMQPPVPPAYGHGLTRLPDRFKGLFPGARMAWRTLLRRPGRTALSVLGLSLAGALLALSGIAWEALGWVLERTFQDAAREDVSVTFAEPAGHAALDVLASWEGVERVEGERAVPVRLWGPGGRWDGAVTARPEGARLRRSPGEDGREQPPPQDGGLVLTDALARKLGVSAGGQLWVERRDGDRRAQAVSVAGLSTEVVGLAALCAPLTARELFGGGAGPVRPGAGAAGGGGVLPARGVGRVPAADGGQHADHAGGAVAVRVRSGRGGRLQRRARGAGRAVAGVGHAAGAGLHAGGVCAAAAGGPGGAGGGLARAGVGAGLALRAAADGAVVQLGACSGCPW